MLSSDVTCFLMLHALLPLRALRLGLGGSHLVTGSQCQSDPTADKSDGCYCKLWSPEVSNSSVFNVGANG